MAKYIKTGKTYKNLFMRIRNSAGNSVKESEECKIANVMPGSTDGSHHLKYIFIEQCENLEKKFAELRNGQMEIVKKLDILESKRCTALVDCKLKHDKHIPAFEETSSSASSTLDHASTKRDSGFAESLHMPRRTHTSLVNDNRITIHKNIGNVNIRNTRRLAYFSNVKHFEMIPSPSEHHGEEEVYTGATSDTSLVIQSASPISKPQMRPLRRFKTNAKEDNSILSYEAHIEHVRDTESSQNRTQANDVTRQNYNFIAKLHKYKTEMKKKLLSTEKSMTNTQADKSEFIMTKSNTLSARNSRKGVPTTLLKELSTSTPSLLDSAQSELKSRQQQTHAFPFHNMPSLLDSLDLESACLTGNQEARKHESGYNVETILCLDTSESMKGPLWTQAVTFAKNFIQEVTDHPCGDPIVFERIGLVTFGKVTRVQVNLTRHYDEVLSKLDTLSPKGLTPMTLGLRMCVAAFVTAGSMSLRMNTMKICPRIILITDGKTTSHTCQGGADITFTEDLDETVVMHMVQEMSKGSHLHIDCVPLGESKVNFLKKISLLTNGKIYKCEDWKKLGRRTKYLALASEHYQDFLTNDNIDFLRHTIMTIWNISREDLDILEESMRRSKVSLKESSELEQPSEDRINKLEKKLLLIGTRVRRGPDWRFGDQDSKGVGTIIGYDKNNWVVVVWDNYDSGGNNFNMYRYAVDGHFDVIPVEEPRVLAPGERIAVGCKVKRGKDWNHGDQDGGLDNVGTVIKTSDSSEKVTVRWPNQTSHKYKFGKKGKYEIQLCDTHKSYTPMIITEMKPESVAGKHLKEIGYRRVMQRGKDIDVEEMNRRNIEISKRYLVLPDSGSDDKENTREKPEIKKVKMDADVPN
ncbi:hypothetical protein ACJMK2_043220 [Sinanodonta woodiana]|uniref:MIB/HERC2 domain-containing protein n=1 Tax=Sinanodonta woodiana TaxID=1069815 RepID=A0ABD3VXL6_SINWO